MIDRINTVPIEWEHKKDDVDAKWRWYDHYHHDMIIQSRLKMYYLAMIGCNVRLKSKLTQTKKEEI